VVGRNEDEVLLRFATRKEIARRKYRSFLEDGLHQGKRDELVGGGLRRSRKLSGSEAWGMLLEAWGTLLANQLTSAFLNFML
jgi:hypothetical protein